MMSSLYLCLLLRQSAKKSPPPPPFGNWASSGSGFHLASSSESHSPSSHPSHSPESPHTSLHTRDDDVARDDVAEDDFVGGGHLLEWGWSVDCDVVVVVTEFRAEGEREGSCGTGRPARDE